MEAIYKATDGQEFGTADEASRHNRVLDALEKVREAWGVLRQASVSGFKTADGEEFDWRLGDTFYYIRGAYSSSPTIERFYFSGIPILTTDHRENLAFQWQFYSDGKYETRTVSLDEVYAKKINAEKRVIELLEDRVGWMQKEIADRREGLK